MFLPQIFFDEDGNGGGSTPPPTEPAQPEPARMSFTEEQQAHIDTIIGRAKAKWEADTAKKAETEKAEAEQEAEAKRLEEEKEYRKLLDLERGKVAELEPLTGQLEAAADTIAAYEATVNELLSAKLEALGDAAKTAIDNLPGEPDVLAKLKWLNANEALFKPGKAPGGGTPPRNRQLPASQHNNNQTAPVQSQAPVIRF